jgi:hypothetical protein
MSCSVDGAGKSTREASAIFGAAAPQVQKSIAIAAKTVAKTI